MSTIESTLADYTVVALPDLSTCRRPLEIQEVVSIPVPSDATQDVLLLALARCLGAYCAATDVLFGLRSTTCDRSTERHALAAVRIRWEHAKTWQEALQDMKRLDIIDDAQSVVRDLGVEAHARGSPFLAVVADDLDYDHALVATLNSNSVHNEHRVLSLKYSTRSFHKSSASILASQTCQILEQILNFPLGSPRRLDFLDRDLLSAVPARVEDSVYGHMPQIQFVVDALQLHDADAKALEYYESLDRDRESADTANCISYGELRKRSNQFAAYLRQVGIGIEDRVALCMLRNVKFHVAMLGVLKAGACYVPIDPDLPRERKEFIIKDCGSKFVFTDDNIARHSRASERFPDDDINVARPDGLAYLLYTSGTTGNPKGCLLTHGSFAHVILALSSFANQAGPGKHRWPQEGRYLAVASIAFDVHLAETFVAFALGMTLVSAPRSQLLEDLPHWISRLRVTHVGIVPSLLEATMLSIKSDSPKVEAGEVADVDLVYIGSGGEKMTDSILERWVDHPNTMLANFYGPSEVTIGCSACIVTSETRKENIGRIFKQCSAYVVDENLDLTMRGCAGELLIGGPLVGRGYHNRPDLTERAFVNYNGEMVYRTGDLVRLMPDDTLEIMGRIDSQIKLRGVRIEAEGVSAILRNAAIQFCGKSSKCTVEVATVLARHPRLRVDQLVSFIVLDSRVSVANRRSMQPQIVHYILADLMNRLKVACAEGLASYMRPAHIIPLTFLPLNANGKADAKALVKLFEAESLEALGAAVNSSSLPEAKATDSTHRLELTVYEAKVADIVTLYTDVPRKILTPYSDLFEIGFNSMKLVHFASKLREAFGASTTITIGTLMRHSTIQEMAEIIQGYNGLDSEHDVGLTNLHEFEHQWSVEASTVAGIDCIETIFPTFPMQDGVLYRSSDIPTLYVQHVILRLHEEIDTERLAHAWRTLSAEREILRTIFYFSSTILQMVLKPERCILPWEEKTSMPCTHNEFPSMFMKTEAVDIARDINENIDSLPPFRLVLRRSTNETPAYLTLSIHHALFDGFSLPQLLLDVEALYLAKEPSFSVPFSRILKETHRANLDKPARFWRRTFEGFDWTRLPQRMASGQNSVKLSYTLQDGLVEWEKRAARRRVSLNTLLTASFAVSLDKHLYDSRDVVFGILRSGRTFLDDELNQAQAPLLSVLPTRVRLTENDGMLKNIQYDTGEALAFEHLSLGRIQQWIQPGHNLFEVLFSVSAEEELQMKIWNILHSSQPHADYILAVEIKLNNQRDTIRIECAFTDYFSEGLISDLIRSIESIALTLAENRYVVERRNTEHVSEPLHPPAVKDSDDECNDLVHVDQELEKKIQSRVLQFLNLKADVITPVSSLVALGLDSIRSIGLSRVLKQDGLKVTPLQIMRHPHIRYIAAQKNKSDDVFSDMEHKERSLLDKARANIMKYVDRNLVRLDDHDEVELYPATTLQSGMLSQTVGSGGNLYVHAFPLRLSNSTDVNRLKRAWLQAVELLSILRTTFHYVPEIDTWIQAVHSSITMHWDEIDGNLFSSDGGKLLEPLQFSSTESFSTPPIRLRLYYESSSSTHVLTLIIHHALYDGISITKLLNFVSSLYLGQDVRPAPQFTDILGYFQYQEQFGTEYWIDFLSGFSRSSLYCGSGPSGRPTLDASHEIPLSPTTLSEACRTFDVTTQCFGQAAFAKVLAMFCDSRDVTFGHVVSGRTVKNAEDVLGPMLNTVPCRVQISHGLKNVELVRAIHQNNLSAQEWQHASLRAIQRRIGKGSIWDSIFMFQSTVNDEEHADNVWNFEAPENIMAEVQYALNIELHQRSDCFIVIGACPSGVFSEGTLIEFLRTFATALESIIQNPIELALPALPCENEIMSDKPANRVGVINFRASTLDRSGIILSDPMTQSFIEILAACMGVESSDITPETPLVSLGVDSISSIRITAKAREAGLDVHAADILRCYVPSDLPKMLELARCRTQAMLEETVTVVPELQVSLLQRINAAPASIESITPATAGMKWLVGMWQLSGRARFHHAFAFKLRNDIDEERLKTAWSKLVDINPILRSTFAAVNSSELYIVSYKTLSDDRLWLPCNADGDTLAGGPIGTFLRDAVESNKKIRSEGKYISDETDEDDVTNIVLSDVLNGIVSKPLSTNLPPVQALFIRLRKSRYFIVHLHHFQYDAWSLRLLVRDLRRLYAGESAVKMQPLPAIFHDAISPAFKEEQKQYWSSYLPVPFKPALFPKRIEKAESERLIYVKNRVLDDIVACRTRARDLHLSLNAVFIASWARVQAEFAHSHSSTFGLWHMGRTGLTDNDTELAIPVMNVLPIHVDDVRHSLREITSQIQRTLRERSAVIQQTDLEELNRWSGGNRGRKLLNVFLNIVLDEYPEESEQAVNGQAAMIMGPLRSRYSILKVVEDDVQPTAPRLDICNLMEDAVLIDLVVDGSDVTFCVEYTDDCLDSLRCQDLVNKWSRFVSDTLEI